MGKQNAILVIEERMQAVLEIHHVLKQVKVHLLTKRGYVNKQNVGVEHTRTRQECHIVNHVKLEHMLVEQETHRVLKLAQDTMRMI